MAGKECEIVVRTGTPFNDAVYSSLLKHSLTIADYDNLKQAFDMPLNGSQKRALYLRFVNGADDELRSKVGGIMQNEDKQFQADRQDRADKMKRGENVQDIEISGLFDASNTCLTDGDLYVAAGKRAAMEKGRLQKVPAEEMAEGINKKWAKNYAMKTSVDQLDAHYKELKTLFNKGVMDDLSFVAEKIDGAEKKRAELRSKGMLKDSPEDISSLNDLRAARKGLNEFMENNNNMLTFNTPTYKRKQEDLSREVGSTPTQGKPSAKLDPVEKPSASIDPETQKKFDRLLKEYRGGDGEVGASSLRAGVPPAKGNGVA